MTKLIRKPILILLSIMLLFIVASCGNSTPQYTVKFDSNGGETIEPIKVSKGDKIPEPQITLIEGLELEGWYLNDEKWSFIGYTVTEDITLKAKWISDRYILNLNSDYFEIIGTTGYHDLAEDITIKIKENSNFNFLGWYDGDNLISNEKEYTFKMPNKNITYKALGEAKYSSGITPSNTHIEYQTKESSLDVILTFPQNENLSSGAAKCYVALYEGDSKVVKSVTFDYNTYTKASASFNSLISGKEHIIVVFINYHNYDEEISRLTIQYK